MCILLVKKLESMQEWKFKEQHAKMWKNIGGRAKRYSQSVPPVVSTLRGRAAPSPPPLRRL